MKCAVNPFSGVVLIGVLQLESQLPVLLYTINPELLALVLNSVANEETYDEKS